MSETFGKLPENTPPLLLLWSEKELFFNRKNTTFENEFEKWSRVARKGQHGAKLRLEMNVIRGATHQAEEPDAQKHLVEILDKFLGSL